MTKTELAKQLKEESGIAKVRRGVDYHSLILWLSHHPDFTVRNVAYAVERMIQTGRMSALAERRMKEMRPADFLGFVADVTVNHDSNHFIAGMTRYINTTWVPRWLQD